jgi:small-conductance mechanosensitive channel
MTREAASTKGQLMAEATESAVEAGEKDRTVALIIAILALLLALSEAGAKNAQHLSTEKNIESSDLYNFYQAKRIRSTVVETAAAMLEAQKTALADPKAEEAFEKQIGDFKATIARFEKDPKSPEDSLDAIQSRAKEAAEARDLASRRLQHYELGSGLAQIAVVLASATIITGISALIWFSAALGVIGAALLAFGFFAPTVLTFIG